ncbi:hypothetical protein H0H92_006989 [Tricholoma furcatifolium]|nr:hypothetical protein H0H92_006989 [Tricholoma furcatifolium]
MTKSDGVDKLLSQYHPNIVLGISASLLGFGYSTGSNLLQNVGMPHNTYWQPFHQAVGKREIFLQETSNFEEPPEVKLGDIQFSGPESIVRDESTVNVGNDVVARRSVLPNIVKEDKEHIRTI